MGIIDDNGQQWERCTKCGGFEKIELLSYEQPSQYHLYGRDIGRCCKEQLRLRKYMIFMQINQHNSQVAV